VHRLTAAPGVGSSYPSGLGHRGHAATYDYGNKFTRVREFDNVRGSDLSSIDGVITSDVLKTLTFDATTRWPGESKMPRGNHIV